MERDTAQATVTALGPARLYRELVYRPGGPLSSWIDANFSVLARPGEPPSARPEAGDLLVRVALGEPGSGHVAALAGSTLMPHHRLDPNGIPAEREGMGWYAVVNEGTFAHSADDTYARRVLDAGGRMPVGQLLLRPRRALGAAEDDEPSGAEAGDRDNVSLPPFDARPGEDLDAAKAPPAAPARRDLLFFGFSGSEKSDGLSERDEPDRSFLMVALTLRAHLASRFPGDTIEIICAWHKDVFVKALLNSSALKIRQIHYIGHGGGGGLSFGFKNKQAKAARKQLAKKFKEGLLSSRPDQVKRKIALLGEAGMMSGFFSILDKSTLDSIKGQLAPQALMHIWSCYAGAPTHKFDANDAYWNVFNAAGASDGIARHIAKSLGMSVTAARDRKGRHGMNFWHRNASGKFLAPHEVRPRRIPQWLWPAESTRWVTYNAAGTGDEKRINFLGTKVDSTKVPPGKPPPDWLTREIPRAAAKDAPAPSPPCSPKPLLTAP